MGGANCPLLTGRRRAIVSGHMVTRRWFLAGSAALLTAPLAAEAQLSAKVYRIGFVSPGAPATFIEGFRRGLQDLGYREGENIVVDYRSAEGRFDRLPDLAAELVHSRVDVIVAVVTQASLAAQKATGEIPIVMVGVADPVGVGLVHSLARPGGNITGTSSMAAEIVGKQLEMLKQTTPKLARLAVLWNPANKVFQALQLREMRAAARARGVQIRLLEVRNPDEVGPAFQTTSRRSTAYHL